MEFWQLQSWYGLMDSALAYQDCYPPMTQHNYVRGQVSSSSRIDYIFLTISLNSFVSSLYTELFPNSDHLLLVTILKLPSSDQSAPKWIKILPCNVFGWSFKKDFAKSFQEITLECSLSQWDLFKKNLVGKDHKSQSQRLFSTRAKIRRAQNILTHLEANQPRDKFSLTWSQKWSNAFETLKKLQMVDISCKSNQIWGGLVI